MIYTIRVTSGREDIVVDMLASKIKKEELPIKTLFHAAEIKGYIFIEGTSGAVQKAIQGLLHIRGLIEKPVRLDEIQHFLEYKKERIKIGIGDIVELIGGPFKKEKGKIQRIDKVKDEVTVELLEASIPIPVTIATEFVKVIKYAERHEEEKPKIRPEEAKPEEKPKEEESVLEKAMEEEEKELEERKELKSEEAPQPKPEENPKKSMLEKLKEEAEEEKTKEAPKPILEELPEEAEEEPKETDKSILEELGEEEKKEKKKKKEEEELE